MKRTPSKPIALNLRISEKTKDKLLRLQHLLSQQAGTDLTMTQTVEAAIDKTLNQCAPGSDHSQPG